MCHCHPFWNKGKFYGEEEKKKEKSEKLSLGKINDFHENGILLHFYLFLCSPERDKIISTTRMSAKSKQQI